MTGFISKDDFIASLRKELKETYQEVGALQAQLVSFSFITNYSINSIHQFLIPNCFFFLLFREMLITFVIVQNEIEKLDELSWHTTPKFQYVSTDLDYITDYSQRQQEKRKFRVSHVLKHNSSSRITALVERLWEADIPIDVFAEKIAAAYALISADLHQTAYLVAFNRETCDTVTPYEDVNSCIKCSDEECRNECRPDDSKSSRTVYG